jgi:endoglucanase
MTTTTVAKLKALTAPASTTRYFLSDIGKEGFFYYDPKDTTTKGDDINCIVSTNGKRFKRILLASGLLIAATQPQPAPTPTPVPEPPVVTDPAGKIPMHPELFYELNSPTTKPIGVSKWFNGVLEEDPGIVNWDSIFKDRFEIRYEFPDEVTLNKIRAFSFQGGTQTPTRFYVITKEEAAKPGPWNKILVAEFFGNAYKTWQEFTFPSIAPKYLIIQRADVIPTELEFYGSYKGYQKPQPDLSVPSVPFKNMVGINFFSWNIVENWASSFSPAKWAEIGFFHQYRHYIGWNTIEPEKGKYDLTGNWNLPAVYDKLLSEGKIVFVCVKGLPHYLVSTYPSPDEELNPAPYGADLTKPESYTDAANMWRVMATKFQGRGMWYEIENERNKWWKGRNGYQTAREYAAFLYACAKAILEIDPGAKISVGGIADNNIDYFRGIIDWYKEFQGGVLNFHALNYHVYASDANQQYASSKGVSPEQGRVYENHLPQLLLAQQYGLKCFIGEIGYDHSPYSTQGPPEINGFTIEQTVGNWNLRSMLLLSRAKLDGLQFYMWDNITDDLANGGLYATSGWHSGGGTTFKYRLTALYAKQILSILGEYRYEKTIQSSPEIDQYDLNGKKLFVAWWGTSENKKSTYNIERSAKI